MRCTCDACCSTCAGTPIACLKLTHAHINIHLHAQVYLTVVPPFPLNTCSNAVKFTHEGVVTVRTTFAAVPKARPRPLDGLRRPTDPRLAFIADLAAPDVLPQDTSPELAHGISHGGSSRGSLHSSSNGYHTPRGASGADVLRSGAAASRAGHAPMSSSYCLRICVSDTGIGIPAHVIPQVSSFAIVHV